MDPNQVPRHRQTVQKQNPVLNAFKEVIFTKPTSQGQASATPMTQPTTFPATTPTSSSFGQGQGYTSSRGQGFYSEGVPTPLTTTAVTKISETPISQVPYVPAPGGYQIRPEVLTQASTTTVTSTTTSSFPSSLQDWRSRSSKEEPIYANVHERARQLDHLFEIEKLETRRQRLCCETGSQTFGIQNVPVTEFPNEIPMPPPLPQVPETSTRAVPSTTTTTQAVSSTVQKAKENVVEGVSHVKQTVVHSAESAKASVSAGLETVKDTTIHTLESARQTAASGLNTVKDTTYHTLETARQTAASGLHTVKDTTVHTLESAKQTAASGMHAAGETLQHAKEAASHTVESVKEGAVTGLSKAKGTTAETFEQVREKAIYGLEKAKEIAAPYVERAVEAEQNFVHQAKEKAAVYGQEGVETAKDTAAYGARQAVEKMPTVKNYAGVAASSAMSLAWAALEIGKETAQLVKEVFSEGASIAKEEIRGKSTTAATTRTRQRHVVTTGAHVVPAETQPTLVLGERVTLTYSEAEKRLQNITEAALDKMNSLMCSGNVVKNENAWKEAQRNLQQFAQFTVKSLWDFVHNLEIVDFPLRAKELENQAFRSEKLIWDRLSDFEEQSFRRESEIPVSNVNSNLNTNVTSTFTEPTVTVRESTIINSSEGTKRSDVVEKYPVNAPEQVVYHSEA